MKKAIFNYWFLCIMSAVFTIYFFVLLNKGYENNNFSCESDYISSGGGVILNAHVRLLFVGNRAKSTIEGNVQRSTGAISRVRYQTVFDFTRSGEFYQLINLSATPLSGNTVTPDDLKNIAPGFWFHSGDNFIATIFKTKDNGYIIGSDDNPFLYCSETNR